MSGPEEVVAEDSLVDLRCSVVLAHRSKVVLIGRDGDPGRGPGPHEWVLPGGRPYPREGLAACARREVLEETGLSVNLTRCAFVAEVIEPKGPRTIEVIFVVTVAGLEAPELEGEPGRRPRWISMDEARTLRLRPPIAGFLPSVVSPTASTAAYLGNLWRADPDGDGSR